MIGEAPVCVDCKNFHRDNFEGLTCSAFPNGIPYIILIGRNEHKKPLENQGNSITFEYDAERNS